MALKFFKDKGFNKLTIGSNSYNTFINSIKNSNELFPILDDDFLIDYRKAYSYDSQKCGEIFKIIMEEI